MRQQEWRPLLTNAVQHNDNVQVDAISARLAIDERLAIAIQGRNLGL